MSSREPATTLPTPAADLGSAPVPSEPLLGAPRWFGALMTILGGVALFFSGLIMEDKIKLILEPEFVPACTLDEVVSCTNVMASPQASAFGFPNPFIGLVAFGVVIAIGVALMGGSRFTRWYWYGYALGLALAVVFVHWLAFQAVFVIGALCIYCMIVWAMVLPLFVMTVVHIARERRRVAGEAVSGSIAPALAVIAAWYIAFAVVIAVQLFI